MFRCIYGLDTRLRFSVTVLINTIFVSVCASWTLDIMHQHSCT